ncbi:YggS family pyridoxal phosphate-dependent enzyme [Parabacteroides pacaensis]|uniref:YggS family pyridoxal phosphate-dependent enzyme n=1 Tax=Parabacteroides pacaensis TaxID=2086575 RepID=UPI000D0ECF45|nr:YggS family pyridoxal phosphate-dependent enzyme [Parabacteroides pacaensis]
MSIASNIQRIKSTLPPGVTLVAISKFHPAEMIREAYAGGQRVFGESKAQELAAKYEELPKDIEWHFIGHLQTNKIKYIASFIHTIQSIDSLKLLQEVDKQAARFNRNIDVLLQIHIAEEETKFGLSMQECEELLQSEVFASLEHITVCGIMGMATNTDNEQQIRKEFHTLYTFFTELKKKYFPDNRVFTQLSMGMSQDYRIAIEEGSTMVRIGSLIFGERTY